MLRHTNQWLEADCHVTNKYNWTTSNWVAGQFYWIAVLPCWESVLCYARFSPLYRDLWQLGMRLDCYGETDRSTVWCKLTGQLLLLLLLLLLLSRVKWPETQFRLATGFTGLLQLVTTSNYNRFTDSHILHFTIARDESSTFSLRVATQRLSAMGAPTLPTPPSEAAQQQK
jgi:hypothetical protein